ncbi:MAG: tRNA dihydrouridine synthase DusB [Tissierellia bacterium]|nr:tRNA dihydrouridine synthase DusB [Tissierellia bacterium]
MKKINKYMAPMAGVTDRAFREILKEHSADICFTEMVNVKGLYYGDEGTSRILDISEQEKNTGIQIFGRDPIIIAKVIDEKLNHIDNLAVLDFNIGCPAPKIFKNKEGSYLMKEPKLVYEILKKMVEVSRHPVSAKIRLGVDENSKNYLEIAKAAEEAGIERLTIHPRTRESYYSGKADWNAIKEVKENISIPVIGNGDIFSGIDALDMIEMTGCDGIMVARGALGNPFIFEEIDAALENREYYPPSFEDRYEIIKKHYKKILEYKPEKVAIREMRKHIAWYLKGLPGSNKIKNDINTSDTIEDVFDILNRWQEKLLSA